MKKSIIGVIGMILMVIGFGFGSLFTKPITLIKEVPKDVIKEKRVFKTDTIIKVALKPVTQHIYVNDTIVQLFTERVIDTLIQREEIGFIPIDYMNDNLSFSGLLTDTSFTVTNLSIQSITTQEITYNSISKRKDKVVVSFKNPYLDPIEFSYIIKYPLFVNKEKYRSKL